MIRRKKSCLYVVLLLVSLMLVSCASVPKHEHVFERKLSEGGLYYLDTCVDCGYWEVYVDEELASRCAPFFGLDENIKLIEKPESIEDYENNILYYALIGDYTPTLHFKTEKEMNAFTKEMFSRNYFHSLKDGWRDRFDSLVVTHADLLAYAMNQEHRYTTRKSGKGYELTITLSTNDRVHYPDGITSEESFFRQQLVALEQSQKLLEELHRSGVIRDSMTDLQKIKAYEQVLHKKVNNDNRTEYGLLKHDGLFGLLNGLDTNCVGTSSNFEVLMRLEGMKAQSYSVEGHMIARILADGRIVLFDRYSKAKFYFSDEEYEEVKKEGGIRYGLGTRLLF